MEADDDYYYHGMIWCEPRVFVPPEARDVSDLDLAPTFSGILRYAILDFDDLFHHTRLVEYFMEQMFYDGAGRSRCRRSYLPSGETVPACCESRCLEAVGLLIRRVAAAYRAEISANRRRRFVIGLLFGASRGEDTLDVMEAAEVQVATERYELRRSPAARWAVERLRKVVVERGAEEERCVVCQTEFDDMEEVTYMPCNHEFHGRCLAKWLQTRHTCPLCRFALPAE